MSRPAFAPDSCVVAEVMPSPNHNERSDGRRPDMILQHYTGMADADAALALLCAEGSKVSAHYFVFEDGRIIQMVPESRRAWHAGKSEWAGETDINSCSIGIEIVNPGHDHGYPDFPARQIAAVTTLCRSIQTRNSIAPVRVLAHSDVAPARKQDPGEKFPWGLLSESGVGHWVRAAPLDLEGSGIKPGDRGDAVTRLQRTLRSYGYGLTESGTCDAPTQQVITAFQRHFRQARVDGVADPSTLLTLRALIETRPPPLA